MSSIEQAAYYGSKLEFHGILSKLPGAAWSKYKGEKHLTSYKFLGPQTDLKKRLDKDDIPLPNSVPINRVDAAAFKHDLAYRDAGDSLEKKHEADRKMVKELEEIRNPSFRERVDGFLTKTAMKSKLALGASLADELHKPFRKPKTHLTVKVFSKNEIWTADIMFLNNPSLKVLIVMDCYTRYLWAIPIANKNANTVKEAFQMIVKRADAKPKKLWVDMGGEF